jgi:dolichol-phosphate mannosyltransferase
MDLKTTNGESDLKTNSDAGAGGVLTNDVDQTTAPAVAVRSGLASSFRHPFPLPLTAPREYFAARSMNGMTAVSIISEGRPPARLSVVVPVFNEADNVLPLLDEIERALAPLGGFEVIFVDDQSDDDTQARLAPAIAAGRLRVLRHHSRSGQSAAVRTGVKAARGEWVVTLDGDGQNDPADIPALFALVSDGRAGSPVLVGGIRQKRQDTLSKRLASRVANAVRQAFLQDGCADSGCGLKLFRRDAFLDLPFFGAIHRFLPALFRAHGHPVAYVPVSHRPRERGVSKYNNWRRGLIGVVDLLGVYWLKQRTKRSPVSEDL